MAAIVVVKVIQCSPLIRLPLIKPARNRLKVVSLL